VHVVSLFTGHSELLAAYAEFVCLSFCDSRIVSTGN